MPYVVWMQLSAPTLLRSDEEALADVPAAIQSALSDGWGVTIPDRAEPPAGSPEVLDIDLVFDRAGLRLGLVLDTERISAATAIGAGFAEHLAEHVPALRGWAPGSLLAVPNSGPTPSGEWFTGNPAAVARFAPAAYLPHELRELCAQYLIAGAVRDLHHPAGRETVDAADVIAGSGDDPWRSTLPSVLGGLLIAAARRERTLGTAAAMVGRGEGDPALAASLLAAVRADLDRPRTGYRDDRMRGHILLEGFAQEHDLAWNRLDSSPDWHDDGASQDERRRRFLWAGLRGLATLTHDLADDAPTPWMWLASLRSDAVDGIAAIYAERDDDRLEADEEDAGIQAEHAADAHLIIQLALRQPALLEEAAARDVVHLHDEVTVEGPLIHLVADILENLGAAAVETAAQRCPGPALADAACALAVALRAWENDEDDACDDLHPTVERLLTESAGGLGEGTRTVLGVITRTATAAGSARAAEAGASLLRTPGELACVITDADDMDAIDRDIRLRVLAKACQVSPLLAADIARFLPELHSDDPRDEPALRAQATTWWNHLVHAARLPLIAAVLGDAADRCPEPGATALRELAEDTAAGHPPTPESTELFVVTVAQATAALTLAVGDPDLADGILV